MVYIQSKNCVFLCLRALPCTRVDGLEVGGICITLYPSLLSVSLNPWTVQSMILKNKVFV